MDIKITTRDAWLSTAICAALDVILLIPLFFLMRKIGFQTAYKQIGIASALFWGILAVVVMSKFWELYYQYFYPTWMRWLAPLDVILYGAMGLGIGWLAIHAGNLSVLMFALLGGMEGAFEHLFGIYGLHILDKVPFLQGLNPQSAIIFSFFEYILYWTIVVWLALGILKIGELFGSIF